MAHGTEIRALFRELLWEVALGHRAHLGAHTARDYEQASLGSDPEDPIATGRCLLGQERSSSRLGAGSSVPSSIWFGS